MTYLGRVPRTGETFTFDRFRFEVMDMDRHRIDKVMLSFRSPEAGERLQTEAPE
jgi:putative hemolysin